MLGPSGYARNEADYYPTIDAGWIVPVLLRFADPADGIWESACGEGHISKVLEASGHRVHSSDLRDRGFGSGGVDFLASTGLPAGCRSIITNPPYVGNMIERFVRHSLELTRPVDGMCAFLVRNEYDSAKTRQWMFRTPAFSRKIILTKRPKWIEGSSASPRHTYAWLVWDWRNTQEPRISWGGPQDI